MLKHGANNYAESLVEAAEYGTIESLILIYEAGVNLLTQYDLDYAAREAASNGNEKSLQFLIEIGASSPW